MELLEENINTLVNAKEYHFTYVSIDIAGSSKIVAKYSPDLVQDVFFGFKSFVRKKSDKFGGIIIEWEGDGGSAVFINDAPSAVLCGIEIVLYLILFNNIISPLPENINIRIGLHCGEVVYFDDGKKMDLTVKNLSDDIQKQAAPKNNMVISDEVFKLLPLKLRERFKGFDFQRLNRHLHLFDKSSAVSF
jgi:class 3 adenylate cyclase